MKRRIALGVISALVVGIAVALLIMFSGVVNVGATQEPSALQTWILKTTMKESVSNNAKDVSVPDLKGEDVLAGGASSFESMCATCHGAPGREPDPLAAGLHPPAPDLSETAGNWTPAELFWITKHGIKMTGMPAWAPTHNDDELWPIVMFMAELDDIDAQRYGSLLARAKASGSGHDHGSHGHGSHGHGSHGEHDSDGHDQRDPHESNNGHHDAQPAGVGAHRAQEPRPHGESTSSKESEHPESGGHDHSGHEH